MRRLILVLTIILLLALPVQAYSGISSARNESTVTADGSCQVIMSITLELDAVPAALVFPLPVDAADISVNAGRVSAAYSGNTRNVDLRPYVSAPGTYTLVIRYNLPDVILLEEETLTLSLPLLSGFDYPIENLSFAITLPGSVEARPAFTSMYYQDTIETMMTVEQNGNTISGKVDQRLQDHETLTMTLPVTAEMFPQTASKIWAMDTPEMLMIAISALALIYWLVSMRTMPRRRLWRTAPSESIAAGAIGSYLTGDGVDLSMRVVSWAQMGYILIQPDDNGRILLHKRMDMGNERSDLESRMFRYLFGKRHVVDGTGYHYAQCCRKAAKSIADAQNNFRRYSGNPRVFACLMLLLGPICGISYAMSFSADLGWRIFLGIILFLLGCLAAWLMQRWGRAFHSRHRVRLLVGIAAALVWIIIGSWAGEWNVGLCVALAELIAGLAAAYGGMRTADGKQLSGELLGLRHYLKHLSGEDLKRILRSNPHFYYDIAPYAMALGVDKVLARQLKNARLPQCPWLTTGMDGHQTATEWNELLHSTVDSLDALQKRLPIDRLLGR